MILVKVSERGQISIPAAARRKLGIKPKSKVEVEVGEKEIILRPVRSISELYGIFHRYAKGKTRDWETIRTETERRVAREIAND